MIRDWTDIELNRMRTQAYVRYTETKYNRVAPDWIVAERYRAYVELDDLIRTRKHNQQNLTLRQDFEYNKKEKTS